MTVLFFEPFFCYDNLYVAKNWARVLKSEQGSQTLILPNRNHENKELYTPMTEEGWEGGRVPVVRGINNKILHSPSEVCLTSHYLNLEEKKIVLFFWGGGGGAGGPR